ncbi:precorrin-2 dehydrogenase/sirohydrochlorin ferrochelatase family protein [Pradoshia sp.]
MQPLIIDLTGKKVVIAGGGRIAARKAGVLSGEEAQITFIAPEMSEEVRKLAKEHQYELIERAALPSDFSGAMLVILATNSREVNGSLANILPANQLVCVVDESGDGNVTFPATVRRGHLQIAVTSNGASPKLTRKLKKELEQQFDESWADYTAWLHEMRGRVKKLDLSFEEKQQILWDILEDEFKDEKTRQRFLSEGKLHGMSG